MNLCFEIHPGEDLHDGISFEMFLQRTGHHPRCKILFDSQPLCSSTTEVSGFYRYLSSFHPHVHVKDAEFIPTGRQGLYGGYQSWTERAGRFRSTGDGQVNFPAIFSNWRSTIIPAGQRWSGSAV
ncbi:hypothetical protein ERHA55_52800 (plasmid) [Erwinia rhapontici]|nr:hypothetical protein ERHA55_52800 [Erwinia rhapontici]